MKIVNVKKFIRTISILVILILIIILFSNKTYSKVDTKYKEESIILGDTLWSISQEESKNNKYFENKDTAFAYELGNVILYDIPKTLNDIGINYYPQSYVYLDD